MPDQSEKIQQLLKFDTPSITNVVATYPADKELCLGLYHPWEGRWYADETLRCMYPEHGRRAGYVVTCVYGLPDAGDTARLGFTDLYKAIAAMPKPVILAVKQNLPPHIKRHSGLLGGNMMTSFHAMGVVGALSDGPSRDLDEIRPLGMQMMLTGTTAGHGPYQLQAINVPVDICGMDVMPGEIVHMDENGATKFPADKLDDVLRIAAKLQIVEQERQAKMRKTSDPVEMGKIISGLYD